MRTYEIVAIIDPDVNERQVPDLIDKYLQVITQGNGTVDGNDLWGRRRLAYPINKKHEGIYVVLNVTAEPHVVQEMDRLMTIDEQFMRTKVMRIDETKRVSPKESAPADAPAPAVSAPKAPRSASTPKPAAAETTPVAAEATSDADEPADVAAPESD